MSVSVDIDPRKASHVELVASTGDITAGRRLSISDDADAEAETDTDADTESSVSRSANHDELAGFFETSHWTADGTTIITSLSSHQIRSYVVPSDILSPRSSPTDLAPGSALNLPEPSNILNSAPYFSLSEPWTNQVLVSCRDHPIQLFSLFSDQSSSMPPSPSAVAPTPAPLASYVLNKPRSEDFLAASSLLWPAPGSHFIAGCRNLLAKFDISRTGEEPLLRIKTIPSERHLAKGGGVGMRGEVSTLGAQPTESSGASLVAAGTWTRWVGLYDFAQAGECVATWSVASAVAGTAVSAADAGIGGGGITQTIWSPCGRYLLLGERKSRGILVYDVRVTGKLLGWLEGREATSNQRISCDVFPGQEGSGGFEVWSGTTQGQVKVWEGVGSREGCHEPAWKWDAHGATVGSTCIHQSGTVVATCSGSWVFPDRDDLESESSNDDESSVESLGWLQRQNTESSLKLWSIGNGAVIGEDLEQPDR